MSKEINAKSARQGRSGKRVLKIVVFSLVILVMVGFGLAIYADSTESETTLGASTGTGGNIGNGASSDSLIILR